MSTSDFKPYYVVPSDKKKQVTHLKTALKDASEVLLATDPDREGESISWHLKQVLKPKSPGPPHRLPRNHRGRGQGGARQSCRRRREPGSRAGEPPHPRSALRLHAVAGAVEEGADRAERRPRAERRRSPASSSAKRNVRAFRTGVYWDLEARLQGDGREFVATLVRVDEQRVAIGKDFDPQTGALRTENVRLLDEATAHASRRTRCARTCRGRSRRSSRSRASNARRRPSPRRR